MQRLFFFLSQYVQKKHPNYSSVKEDTVWSFDRLQSYIDENYAKEKELPENWVYTAFTVSCICEYVLLFSFLWSKNAAHNTHLTQEKGRAWELYDLFSFFYYLL